MIFVENSEIADKFRWIIFMTGNYLTMTCFALHV